MTLSNFFLVWTWNYSCPFWTSGLDCWISENVDIFPSRSCLQGCFRRHSRCHVCPVHSGAFWRYFVRKTVTYRKVVSSNTSRLEAHTAIFWLLMKGMFDLYVMLPFDKELISWLVTRIRTRKFPVYVDYKAVIFFSIIIYFIQSFFRHILNLLLLFWS